MNCRFCQTPLRDICIDLGKQPPSNSFLKPEQLHTPEAVYPLMVYVCPECFLVQLPEHKSSKDIFNEEYVYFSSYSTSWVDHARRYVEMVTQRFGLDAQSQVVEIASNDGYLLQFFVQAGIPCLGVDPGVSLAVAAQEKGVETHVAFFGQSTAENLVQTRNKAHLIIGNNVLAHVPNINDFVEGLHTLLQPEGVITLEFPHLMRLVAGKQFDTIYHEHYSYLSLGTVKTIFKAHGLRLFDVDELPTHGGSLRIYACHEDSIRATQASVEKLLATEIEQGMTKLSYYTQFARTAQQVRKALLAFLQEKQAAGKTVAAYGAAAKGNTLLNFCGVGQDQIAFCVDASPHKQGLYMPGSHIPVLPPQALKERKPDYVLILPWNIQQEIRKQHNYIAQWGGLFVTPIPEVKIHCEG